MKRADKQFLTWLVNWAEGFAIVDRHNISLPDGRVFSIKDLNSCTAWTKCLLPLLFQRAIEGINKESSDPATGTQIYQNDYCIWISPSTHGGLFPFNKVVRTSFYFRRNPEEPDMELHSNEDEAKRHALLCLYKGE
jgi:hypothetical protein